MEDSNLSITVDGIVRSVHRRDGVSLLGMLRDDLGITSARTGCGAGECGACTVLVDGAPVRSCITPVVSVLGSEVITPDVLAADGSGVLEAFLDTTAAQCGYCINGIMMTVLAAIRRGDRSGLRAELDDHLCRCGTHGRILDAVDALAGFTGSAGEDPATMVEVVPADPTGADPVPEPSALSTQPEVGRWVRLTDDGGIEAATGRVEIGQGIGAPIRAIVATAMGVEPWRVRLAPVVTGSSPDEGHTAGSASVQLGGQAIGNAGMALRRLLLDRAAEVLGVDAGDLELRDGTVLDARSGRGVTLSELASDGPIVGTTGAADTFEWSRLSLDSCPPRSDLEDKLGPGSGYLHDMILPGMLHARVVLPPSYHARLSSVDVEAAASQPGVVTAHVNGNIGYVVAQQQDQAVRAAARLSRDATWADPGVADASLESLRDLPTEPHVARDDQVGAARTGTVVAATYAKPYQAHGPVAPSCAVAIAAAGLLTVWSHTQSPYPLRREIAALLGLDDSDVEVRHVPGPGCYGFVCSDDVAALAALAARRVPGVPIRLQLEMEQEFAWDPLNPAMESRLDATLRPTGEIATFRHRVLTGGHTARPDGSGRRLIPAFVAGDDARLPWSGPNAGGSRNADPIYAIEAVEAVADHYRGPLRTGSLRTLGGFFNVYALESFMDELAEEAGQDPVEFRARHLADERALAVLEVAADRAGWQARVGPSGRGLGIGLARYKNAMAYVAQAAWVSVDDQRGVRVEKVLTVCDPGTVVDATGAANQLEGGTVQGISRTLFEEVGTGASGVESTSWPAYPVIRFGDVPLLETVLLDRRGDVPLGVGEAALGPVAAAIANAVDDAIGVRVRRLPLTVDAIRRRMYELGPDEAARVLVS